MKYIAPFIECKLIHNFRFRSAKTEKNKNKVYDYMRVSDHNTNLINVNHSIFDVSNQTNEN